MAYNEPLDLSNYQGFSTFGELSPKLKIAKFDGTFPASQGTYSFITLTGIDTSKIEGIIFSGMWSSGGAYASNNDKIIGGFEYSWYMGNGVNPTLYAFLSNSNSYSLINNPFKVIVFYTE